MALASALCFATLDANAFCRTRTVRTAADSEGCPTEGLPLYHPIEKLVYRVVDKGSPIATDVLEAKLAAAAKTWTQPNARCAPGIIMTPAARLSTDVSIAAYATGGSNVNAIGVSAITKSESELFALPSVHFKPDTGAILDVDLEVSPSAKWSFSDVPPADGVDLETVLLHEVGHMLGLAHSAETTSAMYPTYQPGTVHRTLDDDDMAGICEIYPSAGQRLTARGLVATSPCTTSTADPASGCAEPSATDSGCSAAPGTSGASIGGAGLTFAALVLARRRRARRAR
jgi:hypothetical protein